MMMTSEKKKGKYASWTNEKQMLNLGRVPTDNTHNVLKSGKVPIDNTYYILISWHMCKSISTKSISLCSMEGILL